MRSSLSRINKLVAQIAQKNNCLKQTKIRHFSAQPNNTEDLEQSGLEVKITHSTPSNSLSDSPEIPEPLIASNDTALVDSLLSYTSSLVDESGINIIAFSGGVDSSLAAALVNQVFNNNIGYEGSVKAVIGVSPSLPKRQLDLAQSIASSIDIDLIEVPTFEGNDETYISNEGQACFICKNTLYSALEAVAATANKLSQGNKSSNVVLFNGTNADDTKDPTRLGLLSAKSFSVRSPLIHITKDEVRRAAKHLNLPNWNYAASPCLRSRLAIGVEATENHLKAVNMAEEKLREILQIDETVNMRVRMLSGKRAMIELDKYFIDSINHKQFDGNVESLLHDKGYDEFCGELGFTGGIGVRAFKTGSVSLKN